MLRSIVAIIVAVITWFVAATLGNWILRAVVPGYSSVEVSMNFTLLMMICRLGLGIVASLCAGIACAAVTNRKIAAKIAAVIMVVLFVPVHYMLWAKFPIWYHIFFLGSLVPTLLIGAALSRKLFRRTV